jgi:hypothetical protein
MSGQARLGKTGAGCLKVLHLCCAGCWIGGTVAMLFLNRLSDAAFIGPMLYGISLSTRVVNMGMVAACGAYGCLVTGLLYALFTPWGFFKHNWVSGKWVITVLALGNGIFLLGRWETIMLAQSRQIGLAAFFTPAFNMARNAHFWGGAAQLGLLFLAVLLAVFKPWGNKRDV